MRHKYTLVRVKWRGKSSPRKLTFTARETPPEARPNRDGTSV